MKEMNRIAALIWFSRRLGAWAIRPDNRRRFFLLLSILAVLIVCCLLHYYINSVIAS